MGAGCSKSPRTPVVDPGFLTAVPVPIRPDSNAAEATKEALPPYATSPPLRPLQEQIQNLPPYFATPPLSPLEENLKAHELLVAPQEAPPSPQLDSPRASPPPLRCGDEPQSSAQSEPPLPSNLATKPEIPLLQSPQATSFQDEDERECGGSSAGKKKFAQLSSDRWEDLDSNPPQSSTPEPTIRGFRVDPPQQNVTSPAPHSPLLQAEPRIEVSPKNSPSSSSKSPERPVSAPQGTESDMESAMILDLDLSARVSFSSAEQNTDEDDQREQLATPSSVPAQEPACDQIAYANILDTPKAPRSVAGDMQDQETEENFMSINYSDADVLSVPNSRSGSALGRLPSRETG